MAQSYVQSANTFRLLGDPTRLKLLEVLEVGRGKLCVSELAHEIGASLSATSHQLAKLEALGVVEKCRNGKEICYCLVNSIPITRHIRSLLRVIRADA